MILTGYHGSVTYNGNVLPNITRWSLSTSKNLLKNRCIYNYDEEYLGGKKRNRGTLQAMYSNDDTAMQEFINTFDENNPDPVTLTLYFQRAFGIYEEPPPEPVLGSSLKFLRVSAYLSNLQYVISLQRKHTVALDFTVTGPVTQVL